mmetsp:Transcript_46208/g.128593  ORF Transcript_46208/g.128593 Transcript_46208/m.128593 type:complete len:252 (-) Transcript_46208:597-1352(-)
MRSRSMSSSAESRPPAWMSFASCASSMSTRAVGSCTPNSAKACAYSRTGPVRLCTRRNCAISPMASLSAGSWDFAASFAAERALRPTSHAKYAGSTSVMSSTSFNVAELAGPRAGRLLCEPGRGRPALALRRISTKSPSESLSSPSATSSATGGPRREEFAAFPTPAAGMQCCCCCCCCCSGSWAACGVEGGNAESGAAPGAGASPPRRVGGTAEPPSVPGTSPPRRGGVVAAEGATDTGASPRRRAVVSI